MGNGIFSDDLPDVEESPAQEAGQGSVEQVAGPAEAGQPEQGETGATEEAAQQAPPEQTQPILGKFKTVEDLTKSYQELERRFSSRDEEKDQLRRQVAMLQGYLQALPQIMGQQAQAQTQAQSQAPQQPDEDDKVLKDLEELYPGLNRALAKRYQGAVSTALQNLQTQVMQQIQPIQQYVQQMQLMEFYRQQVASAKGKYADFDEFKDDVGRVYEEQPMLCGLPNGMEIAYQLAKARRTASTQAATQTATEKAAARLPGSSGARADKPTTPEQQFLKETFGEDTQDKGIFDD